MKRNETRLEDDSPMPFGKYKGWCMSDVPARYLHYLWTNGMSEDDTNDIANYIRRNLNSLKIEHPDGIWD